MTGDLLARIQGEIDARRAALEPHVEEYRQLLSAADALGLSIEPTARTARRARAAKPRAVKAAKAPAPRKAARASKVAKASSPKAGARSPRGAAQVAILAALEHGSHTVSELGVVTALNAQIIRENLRRLLSAGAITRAKREGKAAYALATPPS